MKTRGPLCILYSIHGKPTLIPQKLCFSFHESVFSPTRFPVGFRLQPPYSLSSGSITLLEACEGESYLVPCSFVCACVCIIVPNVWVFVYPLLVGLYCTCSGPALCLCLRVRVCSWHPLRACVSLVVFRSIKQFRHLHGLLLRAEDPKKCLTVVQKPRALVSNICSHCELLACGTHFTGRAHTHWHTYTFTRKHVQSQRHAETNLSFSNISGKWQPVGNICSCCLFCLTGCAAQAFSALLKGHITEAAFAVFQLVRVYLSSLWICQDKQWYSTKWR